LISSININGDHDSKDYDDYPDSKDFNYRDNLYHDQDDDGHDYNDDNYDDDDNNKI